VNVFNAFLDPFVRWLIRRREARLLRYMRRNMVCRAPAREDDRDSLKKFYRHMARR
jgi:hypothetical protein